MIDPNKGIGPERLELLRQASLERMSIQIINAMEKLLTDFDMTWDELAERLQWEGVTTGYELKLRIGDTEGLTLDQLNDIAHQFSTETYVIFRPRFPWIAT